MEQIDNPCYSPHLKKVLKSYQTAAMTSLSGPNTFMAAWGNGLNCSPKSNALHTASVITSAAVVDLDMKKSTTVAKTITTTAVSCSPSPAIRSTAVTNCGESGASVTSNANTTIHSSSNNNSTSADHNGSSNNNSNGKNVSISSTSSANHVSSSASNNGGSGGSSHEGKVKKKEKEHYAKYVEYDPLAAPPPFPIQQVPILTAPDQSRSERSETCLEGEIISCFVVGGEKRLCLPQILNSVLRDFSLQQINAVCDELQIFCSRCNPEQLEVLKVTGILPFSAPSCGLITKTDAERLCNALLHCHPPRALHDLPPDKRPFHFKVYHECFGKCKGVYTPDHYTSAHARCIECTECRGLFSPQKFVGHAHKALENRTCHWGYDSANWRGYILLAEDQDDTEQLQVHLDDLKKRFQSGGKRHSVAAAVGVNNAMSNAALPPVKSSKRKVSDSEEKELLKKLKYEETYYPYVFDPMLAYLYGGVPALSRVSAFRPWSPMVTKDGKLNLPVPPTSFVRESIPHPLPPYLSHGPPVLLNPERVVPISETERFERHYQPNVALAPPSAQIQALQKAHNSSSSTAPASASASRAATSRPPSPSCNLPDGNPEIELSTDTDETLSDSTTCSRTESPTHSPSKSLPVVAESVPVVKIKEEPEEDMDVNHELEAMRRLMDDEDVDKGLQERVMEKMSTLCCHLVLKLEKSSETRKQLLQELDAVRMSKRERLREASRAKRQLRKELERLLEDQAHRQQELEELRSEAEYLRRSHVDEAETALDLQQNAQMRSKINGMGQELCKLQEELLQLRKRSGFSTTAGSTSTVTSIASATDDEQRKTERLLDVISHVRSGLAEKKEAESNAAVGD